MIRLALVLALAAKPVAKAYRGPLDGVDVTGQSAAVLARFEHADRASAERTLAEVAKALGVSDALTVSFVRTGAGPVAGLTLAWPEAAALPFRRYTELAVRLSARAGVAETYAVLAPGPRDDVLEQEATWRFEQGRLVDEQRAQYRDHPAFLEMVRKKLTPTRFHAARWPDFPVSQVARRLQLPGRGCLDQPWQLQTLASQGWPEDAGENLALSWVDLPGGLATELAQAALKGQRSASSLVAEVLRKARLARALAERPEVRRAPYDEGEPDAEKVARRTVTLFLPAEELDGAEDKGSAEAVSLSRVVQYAWRRAHPYEPAR